MLRAISTQIFGSSSLKIARFTVAAATNQNKWTSSIAQFTDEAKSIPADSTSKKDMPVDIPHPFVKEPRKCILCKHNVEIDYKNVRLLSQFISPFTGKIYERNITGLCTKQQKIVKDQILKAQSFGYVPVSIKTPQYLKDPKLFDPGHPLRPHRF
nr:EOG090X0N7H [Lepidurus arcticus]